MTVPLLWPRSGAPATGLIASLRDILNRAHNVPMPDEVPLASYVRWATESAGALQCWTRSQDVDRLIRTSTYWAALAMPRDSPAVPHLVNEEMTARRADLQHVVESLELFQRRFAGVPEAALMLVPDTNVLMAHAEAAREADWRGMVHDHVRHFDTVRLVVPLLVVDELDKLKDHTNAKTRTRARLALKLLHGLIGDRPDGRAELQAATSTAGQVTIEVLMESPEHLRLPRADDELVDVVTRLSDMVGGRTVMATFDTGADLRAAVRSIKHVRLEHAHN